MERFFISLAMALVTVLANAQSCPDDNHPHAIDLGLPSGTKWACCNVGATSPEGHGNYYAWGETEVKEIYDWTTYTHCDGSKETCHDLGSDIAGTEHDVAHVKWGGSWEMPSQGQIRELTEQCSYKWTARNGVGGVLFTGPSGGTIFLPESGFWRKGSGSSAAIDYNGNDEDGEADEIPSSGLYWASTPRISNTSHASSSLFFSNGYVYWDTYYNRSFGLTVRPVMSGANSFIDGYQPLVEEGKSWTVQEYRRAGDGTWTADEKYGYYLSGDTLINGKVWKKLFTNSNRLLLSDKDTNFAYLAAVREEDQKVYTIEKDIPEEYLLYDFNMKVGDSINCRLEQYYFRKAHFSFLQEEFLEPTGTYTDRPYMFFNQAFLKLERIDTVQVGGQGHRRFLFSMTWPYRGMTVANNVVWVEGIGSNYGLYKPWEPVPNNGWCSLGYSEQGHEVFGNEDFYAGIGDVYRGNGSEASLMNTTWKLTGFGIVGKEEVRSPELYGLSPSPERYTITFMENGDYSATTLFQELGGVYGISNDGMIGALCVWHQTYLGEPEDGARFTSALSTMTRYELRDGQLRLYYNDGQDFLLLVNQAEAAGIDSPTEALAHDGPLYDLQGRRLAAKPQRGVYIQGGRKYVVR